MPEATFLRLYAYNQAKDPLLRELGLISKC